MYFLSSEEQKRLLRGLLPQSREMKVAEELRGWNWNQPPLQPIYDLKLALFEVANRYCDTSRDLYLRRVMGIKAKPNRDMIQGILLHRTLVKIITRAKKLIYQKGVDNFHEVRKALQTPDLEALKEFSEELQEEDRKDFENKMRILWEFEYMRITSRAEELLSRQPYIDEDSLVFQAVPVVVEQKLDGSFLGLSSRLSADAFTFATPLIFDLKFDVKREFHKLSTTGYALVMEAIYEFPVDIGCLVYAYFKGDRIIIEREFHIIDEELRQNFIEERDEKMRMIYEEIDPGKPEECYQTCPYFEECLGRI